jgi:hypothetical protein
MRDTTQRAKLRTHADQNLIHGEVWLPVAGFEGFYEVSDFGRVRVLNSKQGGMKIKKFILKPCPLIHGYLGVNLYKNKKKKLCKIHRLVALSFLPNIDNKKLVNHKNGDKTNNAVQNLEWSTVSENTKHAYRVLKSDSMINNKLTPIQVSIIRDCLSAGFLQWKIAKYFKVKQSTISLIATGKTWGNATVSNIERRITNTGKQFIPRKLKVNRITSGQYAR